MTALASSFSSAQGAPKEVPKDIYIYIIVDRDEYIREESFIYIEILCGLYIYVKNNTISSCVCVHVYTLHKVHTHAHSETKKVVYTTFYLYPWST